MTRFIGPPSLLRSWPIVLDSARIVFGLLQAIWRLVLETDLIALILRPEFLEGTIRLLDELDLPPYSISNVEGVGRQRGHTEIYRGGEYDIHTVPKIKVEVLVEDPIRRDEAVQKIANFVRTGRVGDGKIFIFHGQTMARCEGATT